MKQSQSVMDALADAATIRLNFASWRGNFKKFMGQAAVQGELTVWSIRTYYDDDEEDAAYAKGAARSAARAAFSAIPELRG